MRQPLDGSNSPSLGPVPHWDQSLVGLQHRRTCPREKEHTCLLLLSVNLHLGSTTLPNIYCAGAELKQQVRPDGPRKVLITLWAFLDSRQHA